MAPQQETAVLVVRQIPNGRPPPAPDWLAPDILPQMTLPMTPSTCFNHIAHTPKWRPSGSQFLTPTPPQPQIILALGGMATNVALDLGTRSFPTRRALGPASHWQRSHISNYPVRIRRTWTHGPCDSPMACHFCTNASKLEHPVPWVWARRQRLSRQ